MTQENLIKLDLPVDVDEALEPRPGEADEYEQHYWGHSDLRVVARALRGHPPRDDDEREARRILLNGILYCLTGEQE